MFVSGCVVVAIQRADTQSSITTICMPACDGLKLPMNLYLVKMGAERSARGSTECGLKLIFDPSEYKKDQVVVVMFESECKFYHTAPDLWNYLRAMSPALVLMVSGARVLAQLWQTELWQYRCSHNRLQLRVQTPAPVPAGPKTHYC